MTNKMITLSLLLLSGTVLAQHDHAKQNEEKKSAISAVTFSDAKLGLAYGQYTLLKEALVASHAEEAKKVASELKKALREAKGSVTSIDLAEKISATSDLDGQRIVFSTLSDEVAKLVKEGKLLTGAIYLDYCPMANDNAGAVWLSNQKEIRNPYFGDAMLKCGSVKEIIH
ncbi:MAG: CzcABC family efflux RND transporter, membrane fusion protein [Cytophagales bacterium]|nr:MAG: CzcABC family efflux RND transporter, membrane fusion protein [Cytophagales bacterium]